MAMQLGTGNVGLDFPAYWPVDVGNSFLQLEPSSGRLAGIDPNEYSRDHGISTADGRGTADCGSHGLRDADQEAYHLVN